MILFRNKLIIFSPRVTSTFLIIVIIGHISICFSESFDKNVELSHDKKLSDDSSAEDLASLNLKSKAKAILSGPIKINVTDSDHDHGHYETLSSEEDEDHHYEDSNENEVDTENETMEKSETFNDPEIKALASTLTNRWKKSFHRTRKAIFGAPRYILVRYYKTFGDFIGIGKHKKEKKKKHKKKKHHHESSHHHHHHHESEEE